MLPEIREQVRQLLTAGRVAGVLALRRDAEGVMPHLFTRTDPVDALALDPKWPLAKTLRHLLRALPEETRLGILCRGCDERALRELHKRNQIDPGRYELIGYPCSAAQARLCLCALPYPEAPAAGATVAGVDPFADPGIRALIRDAGGNRFERWRTLLQRCIKCYGCRNACPICVCEPCKLEEEPWVRRGDVPAEWIPFHLIRAFHLSDSCVACGACQEACPVHLPLLALHLSLREALRNSYGYEAGGAGERSPLLADLIAKPAPGLTLPAWTEVPGAPHGS